jgi:hypothetical protein
VPVLLAVGLKSSDGTNEMKTMNHFRVRTLIQLIVPLTAAAQISPYAGVWTGMTGQNLPIYFRVTSSGIIDSLTIRLRITFPTIPSSSCTATFERDSGNAMQGSTFVSRVALPPTITNIFSRVRGTFLSPATAEGSYDRYSGSYFMYCGSTFNFGTGGTVLSQGTWTATKISPTVVEPSAKYAPESFALLQNYPNPFNPSTVIRYSLPVSSHMTLKVHNLLGQEVETLMEGEREAGEYRIEWQPKGLPNGVYFYRLSARILTGQGGEFTQVRKLVLLR